MGYHLAAIVLEGLWATEDDHDALDIWVAVLVIIISFVLALVWTTTLQLVLASLLGDLSPICLAVLG